jgi:hypothetical protein
MDPGSNLVHLERVRCLDCGMKYVKPADGGTVHQNPGCPRCGYVGWIASSVPSSPAALRRFVADRPRRRTAQSH